MSAKSTALLLGSLCLLSLLLHERGVSAASTVTGCAANSTDITHLFATNTNITLGRGTYCLSEYVFVAHTSGFLLTGTTGDSHDTIIQCSEGAGLAFLNITELTLSYVTILNCGVTGSNLTEFVRQVNGSVDMFYQVPDGSSAGVLIAASSNVNLLHVEIRESRGYGLFAINLYGQSSVIGAVFDSNHQPQPCNSLNITDLADHLGVYVGGGALIMFFDTKEGASQPEFVRLMIADTVFRNNSACLAQDTTNIYFQVSPSVRSAGYVIGGGAGLSIKVCQSSYSVRIDAEDDSFLNNRALAGGGADIVTFRHANASTIMFQGCNFTNNAFDVESQRTFGGGLDAITDLWYMDHIGQNISIIVSDCLFQSNSAQFGGAVAAISPPGVSTTAARAHITFNGCTFLENHATYGSAVYISNVQGSIIMPIKSAYTFDDCIFRNNNQGTMHEAAASSIGSGAFHVSSIIMVLSNSLIEGTTGSGLWTESAYIKIEGTVNITGNSALYGGGITFLGYGFVIMSNNSQLVIENNVAARVGGGIYYTTSGRVSESDSNYDCFLLFEPGDPLCAKCAFQGKNMTVTIMHNHAALGSVIYGSLLDSCLWAYNLSSPYGPGGQNNKSHTIHTLYEEYGQYFKFSPDLNSSTAVNTVPVNPHVDSRGMSNVEVMPGQYFHVAGNALDRLDQPVSDFIVLWVLNTEFTHGVPTFSAQVGEQGLWLMTNNSMTVARVSGPRDSSTTVAFTSLQSAGISLMNVSLTNCSRGFSYNSSVAHCQCDPKFQDYNTLVTCSETFANISVKDTAWFGNLDGSKQLGNDANKYVADYCWSINCNSTHEQAHVQERGSHWLVVNTSDLDAQCPGNRGGLFCDRCREGFSVALGTSRCRSCQGNGSFALIILFAVFGIILLAAIAFLHINVSDGWINGVILYANIYTIFSGTLIARSVTRVNVYFLFNWLSLQWGIESCFYEGMTPLAHNSLELVFPIYLVLLVVATVIISRCSVKEKWRRLFGNPLKVIATMLLLTFTAFMGICMRLLGFSIIPTFSGTTITRWLLDSNVDYFSSGSRIVLVLLSIVIICVLVAFVLFLLIPCRCGKYRLSCCACAQRRALPFIDAFQAPFKDTLYISRTWEGWRFFFRIILHFIANFVLPQVRLWWLLFALILFHSAQSLLSPYRFWGKNVLDSFFTLNMSLLVILLLASDNFDITDDVFLAFYHILLGSAWLVSLSVLLYSCYPVLKTVFVKLRTRICRKGKSVNIAAANSTAYVDPDLLEGSNQEEMTYGSLNVDPAHALDRESFVFLRSDSKDDKRNLTN